MRRLCWPIAAAVAIGVVPALPARAATTPDPIAWGACPEMPAGIEIDPRQQCGTVKVPLDYRNPGGRQISIAVSRIPADDPAKRRGVLLLNPGGPGGEGLSLPSEASTVNPAVLDTYDRIGFDPRGVGHSTPITCGLTTEEMTPPYPYPDADGSIDQNIALARKAAGSCPSAVTPYITTANTARDLDRIRQALGERKISYLGLSYGTYLGAVYAQLFPRHTDRMVLDSALDPAKVWYGVWRQQSPGRQVRLEDIAAAEPGYPVASYLRLAARLDRHPAAVPGSSTALTGPLFRYVVAALMTSEDLTPTLTRTWTAAQDLADGKATDEQTRLLRDVLALVGPSAGVSPGVPADNALAVVYAITCGDVEWPADIEVYRRNVAADRRAYPVSAGSPSNVQPCAFWPEKPVEPPVTITGTGPRNILILQNERDPNTTLESGLGMRRALGRRSVMVMVDAGGHGVYGTSGPGVCATRAADAYLVDGELPTGDRRCA